MSSFDVGLADARRTHSAADHGSRSNVRFRQNRGQRGKPGQATRSL